MQAAGIEAATKLLGRFLRTGAAGDGADADGFAPRFGAEPSNSDAPRSTRDLRVEADQFIDQLATAAKRMVDVWTDLGARGPRSPDTERVGLTVIDGVATAMTVVPAGLHDIEVGAARSAAGAVVAAECFRSTVVDLGDEIDRIAVRADVRDDAQPGVYHGVMTAASAPSFARLITLTIPQTSVATPQPQ